MIVISDTTPIITLLKIERLDLLKEMYGSVKIPFAVYSELTTNSDFLEESEKIKKCEFLEVVKIQDEKKVEFLKKVTGLDLGESEALVLSEEMKADLLLMDEMLGRTVARQMGFTITGAVGILLAAFKNSLVTSAEIKNYVEIIKNSGRHISKQLLDKLLEL